MDLMDMHASLVGCKWIIEHIVHFIYCSKYIELPGVMVMSRSYL